jgi:tRNA (uracil-5-)-methyltransferase TRM9
MHDKTRHHLLQLNREFYRYLAEPFARSRLRPQPAFPRLADSLPDPCPNFLDVGCGEGRLGRFLLARRRIGGYTGVDFSAELLAQARATTPADFYERDLSESGCLEGLGCYSAIACLATLQHLPGRANRARLLAEMGRHLATDGRLILANWQFLDNARQQRKITDWTAVGLTAAAVEPGDYLLNWQRDGFGLRYVCLIDAAETAALAQAANLQIIDSWRSDGKEGNLNLYTILTPLSHHQ